MSDSPTFAAPVDLIYALNFLSQRITDLQKTISGGGGGGGGGSLPPGIQGDILYFNGFSWTTLPPSTAGFALETGGPAANPSWAPLPAGTNGWVPLVTGEVTADGEPILMGDAWGQCIAVGL